jgi:hypothetical protein
VGKVLREEYVSVFSLPPFFSLSLSEPRAIGMIKENAQNLPLS